MPARRRARGPDLSESAGGREGERAGLSPAGASGTATTGTRSAVRLVGSRPGSSRASTVSPGCGERGRVGAEAGWSARGATMTRRDAWLRALRSTSPARAGRDGGRASRLRGEPSRRPRSPEAPTVDSRDGNRAVGSPRRIEAGLDSAVQGAARSATGRVGRRGGRMGGSGVRRDGRNWAAPGRPPGTAGSGAGGTRRWRCAASGAGRWGDRPGRARRAGPAARPVIARGTAVTGTDRASPSDVRMTTGTTGRRSAARLVGSWPGSSRASMAWPGCGGRGWLGAEARWSARGPTVTGEGRGLWLDLSSRARGRSATGSRQTMTASGLSSRAGAARTGGTRGCERSSRLRPLGSSRDGERTCAVPGGPRGEGFGGNRADGSSLRATARLDPAIQRRLGGRRVDRAAEGDGCSARGPT